MEHQVKIAVPPIELAHSDVKFDVTTDGKKLGVLTISKGGIDWKPVHGKKAIEKTWKQFDALFAKTTVGSRNSAASAVATKRLAAKKAPSAKRATKKTK